jgi:hypothetical protein
MAANLVENGIEAQGAKSLLENLGKSYVTTLSVEGNPKVGLLARKSISKILQSNKSKPVQEKPTEQPEQVQLESTIEIPTTETGVDTEPATPITSPRLELIENKYRLIQLLHQGEPSQLYSCEDIDTLERFACKITPIEPDEEQRYISEVRFFHKITK